ncbi:MAG: hypothetical protein DRO94_03630 [Candidatus Altiarchaeales archaeon]|nr:MAG: hypothetical protein DRO95_04310 [Candidatus Altiarchaeales archaeon]RLI94110.1 MAG: hypothetical protein DRO94_03630 [Candidatus Altiarchaeales archaeon]HDO82388.1 hypothetical protein [Candidatus Altiarchaeales archaeon]HEX55037.1 hypothetical protein [Candidatus Altiarchaeales archaeon]
MAVAPLCLDEEGEISLKNARRLLRKTAYLNNKKIGVVFDIIGRVDKPYIVIKLFGNFRNQDSDSLLGKSINLTQ